MRSSHPFEPALFEAIVEQIPDAVVLADRDGAIRVWNRGAEAVFGFAASEVLGRSLDVLIPERLRAAHWQGFHRAIDTGQARHANQVRTTRSLHKDGRKLYVDLSFGVIVDAIGSVVGAVAVGRDCTERYLSEKALRDRLAALEAAEVTGTIGKVHTADAEQQAYANRAREDEPQDEGATGNLGDRGAAASKVAAGQGRTAQGGRSG